MNGKWLIINNLRDVFLLYKYIPFLRKMQILTNSVYVVLHFIDIYVYY